METQTQSAIRHCVLHDVRSIQSHGQASAKQQFTHTKEAIMNIVYNDEFEHAITEGRSGRKQKYRIVVATYIAANLFEHNEQMFDTAYLFVAQDSTDYEEPEKILARPEGQGYGMVTVYRMPTTFEQEFRARVGNLFQVLREGKGSPLHYQESGYVWVYMKKVGNMLWAFTSDDARNYFDFASLNPDSEQVDFSEMDQEEVDTICAQPERVIRVSGDENSDNGFNNWLFYDAPVLYRELLAMDMIAPVEVEKL